MINVKKILKEYLNDTINLDRKQWIGIVCLIIVLSGIFGWLYEFIFYYFNGGMEHFYLQGGNFLPWINIYAIGALIVLILTKKLKKHPILIFFIAVLATGILEYVSGLAIYKLNNGARYWDYNTEILNFGNIDGFVCLRSVLFFGFSSLLLVYLMVPFCIFLSEKIDIKIFLILSITLLSIVLIDEIYNLLVARIFDIPRATQIYKHLGFKYVS